MTKLDWKSELRKRWYLWTMKNGGYTTCGEEVIEFIDSLLHSELNRQKEEILEKISNDNYADGMYDGLAQFTNGYAAGITRAVNIIQSLKEEKV